ncbi:MAG: hypothetical protein HY938_02155 [Nitrosomonadales bacterium]|nr:hypothetical protein [Nitrosomonadales bacterium]
MSLRIDMAPRDFPYRRSIRLQGPDYSRAGAYFVTMCTQGRKCLFGGIESDAMVLNEFGCAVRDEWLRTAEIRTEIQMGEFVVMPNHFHGIVVIGADISGIRRGTARRAPTEWHVIPYI